MNLFIAQTVDEHMIHVMIDSIDGRSTLTALKIVGSFLNYQTCLYLQQKRESIWIWTASRVKWKR